MTERQEQLNDGFGTITFRASRKELWRAEILKDDRPFAKRRHYKTLSDVYREALDFGLSHLEKLKGDG